MRSRFTTPSAASSGGSSVTTDQLVHKGSSAPGGSECVWIDTTNDPTSWDIKILGPSGSWFKFMETS